MSKQNTKNVTVASLAASLKVKPKALRRRLRSLKSVPYVKGDRRWVFTPAQARTVRSMLKAV